MRYLTTLGLAAIAVVALVALGAASSASAAVLCKNNTTTEGCTGIYPAGTFVHLLMTSVWTLENTANATVVDECTASTFESSTDNAGAENTPVTFSVEVEKYKWGGCSQKPTTTTVGGKYEIEWIKGTDKGTLKLSNFQLTANLLFFGSCLWDSGVEAKAGTVVGANPGFVVVENVILKKKGGGLGCPAETRMRATYEFTTPKPLYVAKK